MVTHDCVCERSKQRVQSNGELDYNTKLKKGVTMKNIIFTLMFLFVCVPVHAGDVLFNEGEYWNSIPDVAKSMYVLGIRDGVSLGINGTTYIYEPYLRDLKKEKIPVKEQPQWKTIYLQKKWGSDVQKNKKQIIQTMDFLYADPANAYIFNEDMFYLAKMKLDGTNIEDGLARARQRQANMLKPFP